MPLGLSLINSGVPKIDGVVFPSSLTNRWVTFVDAGVPAVRDAATITNPDTQITAATERIIKRLAVGTNLLLRLKYDVGLTAITSPVVKVFGRTTSLDAWQLLKTRSGALTATLQTAATDVSNGTFLHTTPDASTTSWDCLGCEEFLVGIETALAGTGTTSNSTIEAKII